MFRFYEILDARKKPQVVTAEEIEIAEGRKTFANRNEFTQFLRGYRDAHQQTLRESFERAGAKAMVSLLMFLPFDQ